MLLVDTGFLIALVDPSDPLRPEAEQSLLRLSDRLILHQFVVTEFLNYFSASHFRLEAHRLLDVLGNRPDVEFLVVDEAMYAEARALHRDRPDKAWSLTDCISFIS